MKKIHFNSLSFKCLVAVFCIFTMIFIVNNTFAAINEDYYNQVVGSMQVFDANLDTKVTQSVILDLIAKLIYGLGSLGEWILGGVFKLLTGTNMFPWADAILFNAVPFLDINIFNPSEAAFVTLVQDVLQKTYYTVFSLAMSFFGIAVMITAIKLALTAIAEDKAKYKKAIVDWLLGLVMLVGIHYFISFVLYLNEQLVVMASEMATQSLEDAGTFLESLYEGSLEDQERVDRFIDAMTNGKWTWEDWLKALAIFVAVVATVAAVAFFAWLLVPGSIASGSISAFFASYLLKYGTAKAVGMMLLRTAVWSIAAVCASACLQTSALVTWRASAVAKIDKDVAISMISERFWDGAGVNAFTER